MNTKSEYQFNQQGIIFAYDRAGEFCGALVTEPDEVFTKDELMECFEDLADYLVAADLAEWAYGTKEQVQMRLEMLIEKAMEGDTSYLTIKYHIPKTVH